MTRQTHFQYGDARPLELSLRDDAWVGIGDELGPADVEALDATRATIEAFAEPIGFPPLSQAMVPGDRVAIALGAGVRQTEGVVRGAIAALEQAGAGRESMMVVCGNVDEAATLRTQLGDLVKDGCLVVGHAADDEQALCYLAAVDNTPLLMCRQLYEADVVIPIGCGRPVESRDARGPYESLYPRFSDVVTQRRYRQADALDSPLAATHRREETDRAGWLLGAAFVVQVVPSPGGGVARVIAGDPSQVDEAVNQWCDHYWVHDVHRPARLVVASLAGDGREQTWDNLARALHAASLVAEQDDSAVAICTEIDSPPGEALSKLMATGGDVDRAATELPGSQSEDAGAAWEIYKALCRGPVYFMSQLDEETVEELGMTPIANEAELARLVERSESCLVMNEGQHAVPRFATTDVY